MVGVSVLELRHRRERLTFSQLLPLLSLSQTQPSMREMKKEMDGATEKRKRSPPSRVLSVSVS